MTATYRYSADGVKLKAKVSSGTSNVPAGQPTAYAYLGSLVYSKVGGSYQLESTGFSGGRIVPSDTQHPVHYHITDHLGSVRVVAWPEEGDDAAVILEQNDYYPYGLRMDNGLTAGTDNRYRFSGKEAQPLMGGSILDFGARYYNPTIARWTTIDPKAEEYYTLSPFMYCHANPISFIDPDGEADYFSKQGALLFSDCVDDGLIRVMTEDTFNELLDCFSSDTSQSKFIKALHDNSMAFKDAASSMTQDAVVGVLGYYNETGYPIVAAKFSGNFMASTETGKPLLLTDINNNINSSMFDSSYNIKNAMNGHEDYHFKEYFKDPWQYDKKPRYVRELEAFAAQRAHPTWSRTTEKYQSIIAKKEEEYESERNKSKK